MVEANGLRGQFAGWTRDARDQKLQGLAEVLDRFRPPWTFDFSISRAEYESHVSPASPRGLSTPYFAITFGVVSAVARHLASQGAITPVTFVFLSGAADPADPQDEGGMAAFSNGRG
ncbi:MAG: hypothetical protein E5Y60_25730 [Mesorhizobium sp.]|nr:MAG: hypothetical protein E5Y60_25730 [Mesorhizobium sp.]